MSSIICIKRRCIVKISRFLFVTLAVMLIFPCLLLAYGGGEDATQVGIESGLDSGKICQCKTLEEVRKGQRWHTRPGAMKKTAYEFLDSFHDAERNLLDSYDTGAFTDEEMKDILRWLKDNKMYMSDKALKTLNKLSGTPEDSVTKSSKITSSGKSTQTTAVVTVTKPNPVPPKKVLTQSIALKHMAIHIAKEAVRKKYAGLKNQYPNKNEFAIQDLLYRKIFTKEERNFIESDLKNHMATRALLNEVTK
jgi:hypothetical protein